jgi:hypothetical protein
LCPPTARCKKRWSRLNSTWACSTSPSSGESEVSSSLQRRTSRGAGAEHVPAPSVQGHGKPRQIRADQRRGGE